MSSHVKFTSPATVLSNVAYFGSPLPTRYRLKAEVSSAVPTLPSLLPEIFEWILVLLPHQIPRAR